MRTLRSRPWLDRIGLVALVLGLTATSWAAQTTQTDREALARVLGPGTTVWLTDTSGREAKVRIANVAGGVITADDLGGTFRLDVLQRVRVRENDSVLNGALIGAGTLLGIGLRMCTLTEPWDNCRDDVGPMLKLGALGAAAGAAIDALFPSRRTIFGAPSGSARLEPLLMPGAGGVRLSLKF